MTRQPAVKLPQLLPKLVRPQTTGEALLAALVLYNPLGCFALLFATGSPRFFRSWGRMVLIADLAALQCLLAVTLLRRIELGVRGRLGAPPIVRSVRSGVLVSVALLPLALPGALVGGAYASWLVGLGWYAPELDLATYRTGIGLGLLIVGGFAAQRVYFRAKEDATAAEARIKALENRRLEAQLAALTAEMNPHLLFNALNTVASLIHSDPDAAEQAVVDLADLYRGTLRACATATHALRDELRLCDAYLKVEKARFGERLQVKLEVAPEVDVETKIPVLLLQPFIENAVKHGVSQRVEGGTVLLGVATPDGGGIVARIEDDGVGLGASKDQGAGRAVANCKERLALVYGERARIDLAPRTGGGTRVTIELPETPLAA